MRGKIVGGVAFALLLAACGQKKGASMSERAEVPVVDTFMDSTDSLLIFSDAQEEGMSSRADELFDDFFFNFAANHKLQLSRINFPLPVDVAGEKEYVGRGDWRMDHFFMRQGYYTLIFDDERQMELVKDTAVAHVVVEKVSFAKKTVKQYLFDRIGGLWKMTAISYKPLYENKNASFLRFYERFATDSAFQVASLANPVVYVGADPNDDFATAESEITPEMWPDFASEMPSEMIYNLIYGQTYTESDRKVFVIRGISNGLEVDMVFERRGGRWLLTKLTA